MQREGDGRLQDTERAREADRSRYEATIKGLQQELEMQTTLYKKYVERLGTAHHEAVIPPQLPPPPSQFGNNYATGAASPVLGAPGPIVIAAPAQHPASMGSPSRAQQEMTRLLEQQLQQLEGKLGEKDTHIRELQESLAQARMQLEEHWRTGVREKQQQYEQLRASQQDSDFAMQQMRQDLEAAQDKIRALIGEKKNFESLQELYEQVKVERDDLRKECFTAAVEAETAKREHLSANEQLRQQMVDRAAQEKLAEEFFKEKEAREQAERTLFLKEEQYQGELLVRDRQLDLQGDAYRQGQKAGREEVELRLRESERRERELEEECGRLRGELAKAHDTVQRGRDEVTGKERELAEWASAFQTAEQHKVRMGVNQDEMMKERSEAFQQKAASDLRANVLQQHVARLEEQLRKEQERCEQLTQAHAQRELDIAQREVDFRDREVRLRDQTRRAQDMIQQEHAAEAALERQKISREMEMVQREAELRDQAQRREQERLLEQTAQELAGKELEIASLKRELGQVRGQHGHLQSSLNSALSQVAALGQKIAVEQQHAVGIIPSGAPFGTTVSPGRGPPVLPHGGAYLPHGASPRRY